MKKARVAIFFGFEKESTRVLLVLWQVVYFYPVGGV